MNLFDSLDDEVVRSYVKEVTAAQEHDTLVQSPEELGRWLALVCSRQPRFAYAEVGVGAGGTFRLTREVLGRWYSGLLCIAIDNGSDAGFQGFLKWLTERRVGVKLIVLNVDDPNAYSSFVGELLPNIDTCMLDAAHTYTGTWNAFRLMAPLMGKWGLIAVHDTDEPRWKDVGRAVQDIARSTAWNIVAHYSDQFGLTVLGRS